MKSEFRWFALTLILPLVFSACTRRQVGSSSGADTYQYVAQGLCLTFVMDKIKRAMEPGSVMKDAMILSKDSDERFRAKYLETSRALGEAKTAKDKERLEKAQIQSLLELLKRETPDLIKKCDRLADGFRRCDKFQNDRDRMRACLERENREPMEQILAFLNRDAAAGFTTR
jgi:hypothetical protein